MTLRKVPWSPQWEVHSFRADNTKLRIREILNMCSRCHARQLCRFVGFTVIWHRYPWELSRIRLYCFFELILAECFHASRNLFPDFSYGNFALGTWKLRFEALISGIMCEWIPDTFLRYFSKHFRDVGFTILWDFAGYERWKEIT